MLAQLAHESLQQLPGLAALGSVLPGSPRSGTGELDHASERRMPLEETDREGFGHRIDVGRGKSLRESIQGWQHLKHIPEGAQAHDED